MAATVFRRIFAKSKFVVPPKKNLLTSSLCTVSPTSHLERTARFQKDGWEFSNTLIHDDHPENYLMNEFTKKSARELPSLWSDNLFSIKHLESGITFRFRAYDVVSKWREEKETRNPLASDFPSYASPLLPFDSDQYDSAYVGRVIIEKPGEQINWTAKNIYLEWEDVDKNALDEQIVWTTKNKLISGVPDTFIFYGDDGQLSLVNNNKRKAKKSKAKKQNQIKGLLEPLVNFALPCYTYEIQYDRRTGGSSCKLFLVVTEFGWFAYLHQFFFNNNGAKRIREMTMHCAFKQNVIYREITERQSKDFLKKLPNGNRDVGEHEIQDTEMIVLFHEVKQFRMQDANIQDMSKPKGIRDATQYGSFAIEAPGGLTSSLIELPFSDTAVESFVATSKPIQFLEENTRYPVKIIPLFTHPCDPYVPSEDSRDIPRQSPRKVYFDASEILNELSLKDSKRAQFMGAVGELAFIRF